MATTTSTSQYPEPPPYEDIDAWIRYYRDFWGINTIPAPTQDKGKDKKDRRYSWIPWQPYQNQPISDETQESYIRNGEYTSPQGLGLLPGKVWFGPNNGKWLVAIDGDNETAKNAGCEMFGCETLEQVAAKGVVVEQHQEDAPHKAHFYFYSDTPFHNLPGVKPSQSSSIPFPSISIAMATKSKRKNGSIHSFIQT